MNMIIFVMFFMLKIAILNGSLCKYLNKVKATKHKNNIANEDRTEGEVEQKEQQQPAVILK